MSETRDKSPVPMWFLTKAFQAMDDALAAALTPKIKEHRERLEALEQRLAQLEAQPHMKFVGPWQANATYEKGDVAQRRGLWLCTAPTTAGVPGKDFDSWRLIVKQGALHDD